jgi:hypothetical protein
MASKRKAENLDARHGLSNDFVAALADDWKAYGIETIQRVREQQPEKYCQLVAQIVPKELLLAADRQPNLEAPANSRQIAERLLGDFGITEGISDQMRERTLQAYDLLNDTLQQIADEAIGLAH